MPLFSIIIPTYNRANYLNGAIACVKAQTFTDYEVIIVDDGSTDTTEEARRPYDNAFTIIRQPNGGEGSARNTGVAAARGRYIAWLDSDDLWLPWALETFALAVSEFDNPCIVMGGDVIFSTDEELLNVQRQAFTATRYEHYLAASTRKLWRGVTGNVVSTELTRQLHGFSAERMVGLDIDFLMRAGTAPGFVKIETPITYGYRMHDDNITRNLDALSRGVQHLIAQERAGAYPGGEALRPNRLELVTFHARAVSRRCAENGRPDLAWKLYRATLPWHLSLGAWRYLLGLPALAALKWRQ